MWAILGLIPKQFIAGALLVLVTLGGSLVQRQCTVMQLSSENKDLKHKLGTAENATKEWQTKHELCAAQSARLQFANEGFAQRVEAQSSLVEAMKREADERVAAAKQASKSALKEADYQRETAEWLATMLRRRAEQVGECPEAAGVGIVRDGLGR